MSAGPTRLLETLDLLERLYGKQEPPPPRGALEWILWENAVYLQPDERRLAAYRALEKRTRLTARGILSISREELLAIAELGGMHPETRLERWLESADLVQREFGGDLESVLALPLPRAKKALRAFPTIGEPGAEKILLFTRTHPLPALESNGLRVLVRLGHARQAKNYATTYKDAQKAFAPLLSRGCSFLIRAHLLLRRHGQELCKNAAPRCDECPLALDCPAAE